MIEEMENLPGSVFVAICRVIDTADHIRELDKEGKIEVIDFMKKVIRSLEES